MKAIVDTGPKSVTVAHITDARIERPTDVLVLVRVTSTTQRMEFLRPGNAKPSFIVSNEIPLGDDPAADKHVENRDDVWT